MFNSKIQGRKKRMKNRKYAEEVSASRCIYLFSELLARVQFPKIRERLTRVSLVLFSQSSLNLNSRLVRQLLGFKINTPTN